MLKRVADWNEWTDDDLLLQLVGHLKRQALQEWNLLPESERTLTKVQLQLCGVDRTQGATSWLLRIPSTHRRRRARKSATLFNALSAYSSSHTAMIHLISGSLPSCKDRGETSGKAEEMLPVQV